MAWFRLSRFGATIKSQGQIRFHDTASYVRFVESYDQQLSPETKMYLEEAAASFYAECLLAASVMLGVAAEAEFLRVLDGTSKGPHAALFAAAQKEWTIRKKIQRFQTAIQPLRKQLWSECEEELDTNLSMIQGVLRVARNGAGHPSGRPAPDREQVFTNLRLFGPFARQISLLRKELG